MKYWKSSMTVLAVLGSVLGTETAIALNQSHRLLNSEQGVEASAPTQLAQRFDSCRRANTSIFIYRDRSPERPLATVQANEQIQLAEQNPIGGWIAVNAPVRGFVEARFLTRCDDGGDDTLVGPITQIMSSRLCVNNRPSSNAGLPIYSEPRTGSRTIDRVFRGEEVTATNYSLDRRAGRLWLRISRPVPGWVDYGNLTTGEVNFIPCALQN